MPRDDLGAVTFGSAAAGALRHEHSSSRLGLGNFGVYNFIVRALAASPMGCEEARAVLLAQKARLEGEPDEEALP